MDERQAIGRCEVCNELIYDDNNDFYLDEDGSYYCCLSCALVAHGIFRGEESYNG